MELKRTQNIYNSYFYGADSYISAHGYRNACISNCEERGVECSSVMVGSQCKFYKASPSLSYGRVYLQDEADTGFIRLCRPCKLDRIEVS